MPDITVPIIDVNESGVAITATAYSTLTDTYLVENNGRVAISWENTAASAVTVTIITTRQIEGLAVADRPITVSGNATFEGSGYDPNLYGRTLRFTITGALNVAAKRHGV